MDQLNLKLESSNVIVFDISRKDSFGEKGSFSRVEQIFIFLILHLIQIWFIYIGLCWCLQSKNNTHMVKKKLLHCLTL